MLRVRNRPTKGWRRPLRLGSSRRGRCACAILFGVALSLPPRRVAAALDVQLVIGSNEPTDGFADSTPVEPVGGNDGTTLGEQRWLAVQHAADIWATALDGATPVVVAVSMPTFACGVFGGTQSNGYLREGAKLDSNQVYSMALAEQLAGRNLNGTDPDILLELNGATCAPGDGAFYLGLDADVPVGYQSLTSTVLHELAHGFGFESLVNPVDGAALMDAPGLDPYSRHLFDIATGKYWHELTAAERALSAATPRGVVWDGDKVRQSARSLLALGEITLSTETAASGFLGAVSTTSAIAPFKTFAAPIRSRLPEGLCESPPALPAPVQHVLLVAESNCSPVELAEIGAAHGALAVIEVEAGSQSPPPTFGSRDVAGLAPRIPVLRVGRQDGELLGEAVGSDLTLAWNEDSPAGADSEWRPYVYTPARPVLGASLSHWDSALRPSALLEPSPAVDHDPFDITLELAALVDLGWESSSRPWLTDVSDAGVDSGVDLGMDASDVATPSLLDAGGADASAYSAATDSGDQSPRDASAVTHGSVSPNNIRDAATNVDAAIAEAGARLDTAAPGSGSAACSCRLERRNGEGMSWLLGSAVTLACLRRRSVRSKC